MAIDELLRASRSRAAVCDTDGERSRVEPRAARGAREIAHAEPSATRRSPRASVAGWTVAATGSNTPAQVRGASRSDARSIRGAEHARTPRTPYASPRPGRRPSASTCAGVDRGRPDAAGGGSGREPARRRRRRSRSTAAADTRPARRTRARLRPAACEEDGPLRPRATAIHARRGAARGARRRRRRARARRRRTRDRAGLSSIAVHSPTKPPPRIATSACSAPSCGGSTRRRRRRASRSHSERSAAPPSRDYASSTVDAMPTPPPQPRSPRRSSTAPRAPTRPAAASTSTNPASIDDVVAEVLLGDAATLRRRLPRRARRAARVGARCRRPRAAA